MNATPIRLSLPNVGSHSGSCRCKDGDKRYIGQTTQGISTRWRSHIRDDSYCVLLSRAIKKYGVDSFCIFELARAESKEELNDKEIYYISLYETNLRDKGFNLRGGGSFGKHSAESKAKISIAVREAINRPDVRNKLILARTGKKRSQDFCDRASQRMSGTTVCQESKVKISKAVSEHWKSDEYRNRVTEGQRKARANSEYIKMVADNTKAQWGDKEKKERLVAAMTAGKLAMWADPEKKAAILAKRAATAAAKRAVQI